MSFVHLHCHSEGSLLDGMCRVKDMVVTAREMGMPAVALTDHGVMYNAIEFYQRAHDAGVKPIVGCCLPGQPVYTEHGIKSIEEIQVGERVLTHRGRYRPVTRTMTRRYQGTLYGIVTHGAATVWLTDEHPILVAGQTESEPRWVRADAVLGGYAKRRRGLGAWRSFAAVPRLAPEAAVDSIHLCDFLDPAIYAERNGTLHKAKCFGKFDHEIAFAIPTDLPVTAALAFFLGLFLAEGCFSYDKEGRPTGIRLCFGRERDRALLEEARRFLEAECHLTTAIHDRSHRGSMELLCHSTVLARFLHALCGAGVSGKHIPSIVYQFSSERIRAFLDGLAAGDGRIDARTSQVTLRMANRDIIYGARLLAVSLGWIGRVTVTPVAGKRTIYSVSWTLDAAYRRYRTTDAYLLSPIKDVAHRPYDGPVFNLEVAEDHSYVTDIAVHNCEVYVSPGHRGDRQPRSGNNYFHQVLLARDLTGYKNLVKLVSRGFLEGFYYKPRVDKELLAEHAEGLIATSACLGGEIPGRIMAQELKQAEYLAGQFREIFGAGNFYLELQNHGLPEQKAVNEGLVAISRRLDLPLLCTNDVHYLRQEDAQPHEVLLCIQTGTTMNSPKRLRYGGPEFYLASPAEMRRRFSEWPEALENTLVVAERCNLELDFSKFHLPHYEVPPGYTYESYLEHLCREALGQRYGKITPEHEARLQYELEVIQSKGYAAYFLIVWDFVRYARSVGIMSQARGSAAGSIVSYLLGLTVIDPIHYGLLFERFLTRERKSMPDIDLDFADDRREEVIQYCRDKYGEDKVAQIIAFGTMAARAAVRDAGRALDIPIPEVDRIAKLIPTTPGMTLDTALQQSPDLARMLAENATARTLITTAKSVEGLYRHASTHAAAVVITREPVVEYAPVQRVGDAGVTIQFTKDHVEKIGLLKMDFLGLRNLTVVDKCLRLIERTRGVKIDLEALPLDDAPTYRLLQNGESIAVFQLESSGMQKLLRDLKPDKLEDIIALVALYRPGPLGSGMTEEYCRRKHGLSPARYPHPSLEPILKDTYGIILYQEQVMKISMVLAGFSAGQAEDLMKAMSKKKVETMEKLKPAFLSGAKERGVDPATAQEIYDVMYSFASYGFGLNHSAAYAVLTYQTAYLKANFPAEFMATNCSSIMDNKERLALYIEDIRRLGLAILPPDINESEADFTVRVNPEIGLPDGVRFGMAAVKNVSRTAVEAVVRARAEGEPFRSLTEFARRVYGSAASLENNTGVLNRSALECLIKAGAFDPLDSSRAALLAAVDSVLASAARLRRDRSMGQVSLFGEEPDVPEQEQEDEPVTSSHHHIITSSAATREEALRDEKELLGVYLSDHPLNAVTGQLRRQGALSSEELKEQGDRQQVVVGGIIAAVVPRTTRKGQPMAALTLEDLTGTIPVTVFPKVYEEYARLLEKDRIILVKGKTSIRERLGASRAEAEEREDEEAPGIVEVHAEEILPLHSAAAAAPREPAVHLRLTRARPSDLNLLRTIAADNPGAARLYLHVRTSTREEHVLARLTVATSRKLVEALQGVAGRGEVWVE